MLLVYNGEVYNFRSLRAELSGAGWNFKTTSDAEVLLAGYQEWGTDIFVRARGMWAAAFWHPVEGRLLLARDPLGKKPLLYSTIGQRFAFASSVTALLPLLEQTPEIDRSALECYLGNLVVPFEHSMFDGILKVPPGTVVTWDLAGGLKTSRYWFFPPTEPSVIEDPVAETERLLRVAVRRRLESDVPLGVFLSAGFDSGLIAALAAQEGGKPVVAVTAGTSGSGFDEREAAGLVARRYGLEHHCVEVPSPSAAALPALIAELGEPFGDPSILPSYAVARAARRTITVALTGDGGDEAFYGYATFRAIRAAEAYRTIVPRFARQSLWRATRRVTRKGWLRRVAAVMEYGAAPLYKSYRNRMAFGSQERKVLLRPMFRPTAHNAEHIYADRFLAWSDLPDADAYRRVLYETFLPNDYLTKVDTASMAASLEARSPFLDVDLVEFVLRLPGSIAFPGGHLKALLRPLVRRYLPREIRRRRKTGFDVPIGSWLNGPLRSSLEEFVFRNGTLMTDLIDVDVARHYVKAHERGLNYATQVWGLLALGVWLAVMVEQRWSPSDPMPLDPTGR